MQTRADPIIQDFSRWVRGWKRNFQGVDPQVRTDERIPVAYHGVRFPDHLVRHPEVEIESRLILAEPQQLQRDGDGRCLAVVNRGPPGCSAPEASNVRPLGLRNLQRSIRATLYCEGHEFPQGEAIERQLESGGPCVDHKWRTAENIRGIYSLSGQFNLCNYCVHCCGI